MKQSEIELHCAAGKSEAESCCAKEDYKATKEVHIYAFSI